MRASQEARWKRAKAENAKRLRKYQELDQNERDERKEKAAAELERRRQLRKQQDDLMRKPWKARLLQEGRALEHNLRRSKPKRVDLSQAQKLEGRWRERVEASAGLCKFIRGQRAAKRLKEKQAAAQEEPQQRMKWEDVKHQAALGFSELVHHQHDSYVGALHSGMQATASRARRRRPEPYQPSHQNNQPLPQPCVADALNDGSEWNMQGCGLQGAHAERLDEGAGLYNGKQAGADAPINELYSETDNRQQSVHPDASLLAAADSPSQPHLECGEVDQRISPGQPAHPAALPAVNLLPGPRYENNASVVLINSTQAPATAADTSLAPNGQDSMRFQDICSDCTPSSMHQDQNVRETVGLLAHAPPGARVVASIGPPKVSVRTAPRAPMPCVAAVPISAGLSFASLLSSTATAPASGNTARPPACGPETISGQNASSAGSCKVSRAGLLSSLIEVDEPHATHPESMLDKSDGDVCKGATDEGDATPLASPRQRPCAAGESDAVDSIASQVDVEKAAAQSDLNSEAPSIAESLPSGCPTRPSSAGYLERSTQALYSCPRVTPAPEPRATQDDKPIFCERSSVPGANDLKMAPFLLENELRVSTILAGHFPEHPISGTASNWASSLPECCQQPSVFPDAVTHTKADPLAVRELGPPGAHQQRAPLSPAAVSSAASISSDHTLCDSAYEPGRMQAHSYLQRHPSHAFDPREAVNNMVFCMPHLDAAGLRDGALVGHAQAGPGTARPSEANHDAASEHRNEHAKRHAAEDGAHFERKAFKDLQADADSDRLHSHAGTREANVTSTGGRNDDLGVTSYSSRVCPHDCHNRGAPEIISSQAQVGTATPVHVGSVTPSTEMRDEEGRQTPAHNPGRVERGRSERMALAAMMQDVNELVQLRNLIKAEIDAIKGENPAGTVQPPNRARSRPTSPLDRRVEARVQFQQRASSPPASLGSRQSVEAVPEAGAQSGLSMDALQQTAKGFGNKSQQEADFARIDEYVQGIVQHHIEHLAAQHRQTQEPPGEHASAHQPASLSGRSSAQLSAPPSAASPPSSTRGANSPHPEASHQDDRCRASRQLSTSEYASTHGTAADNASDDVRQRPAASAPEAEVAELTLRLPEAMACSRAGGRQPREERITVAGRRDAGSNAGTAPLPEGPVKLQWSIAANAAQPARCRSPRHPRALPSPWQLHGGGASCGTENKGAKAAKACAARHVEADARPVLSQAVQPAAREYPAITQPAIGKSKGIRIQKPKPKMRLSQKLKLRPTADAKLQPFQDALQQTEEKSSHVEGVDGPLRKIGSYAVAASKASNGEAGAAPRKAHVMRTLVKCLPPVLPGEFVHVTCRPQRISPKSVAPLSAPCAVVSKPRPKPQRPHTDDVLAFSGAQADGNAARKQPSRGAYALAALPSKEDSHSQSKRGMSEGSACRSATRNASKQPDYEGPSLPKNSTLAPTLCTEAGKGGANAQSSYAARSKQQQQAALPRCHSLTDNANTTHAQAATRDDQRCSSPCRDARSPASTSGRTESDARAFQSMVGAPFTRIPKPSSKPAWAAPRSDELNASFEREFGDLSRDPEVISMLAQRRLFQQQARRYSHVPSAADSSPRSAGLHSRDHASPCAAASAPGAAQASAPHRDVRCRVAEAVAGGSNKPGACLQGGLQRQDSCWEARGGMADLCDLESGAKRQQVSGSATCTRSQDVEEESKPLAKPEMTAVRGRHGNECLAPHAGKIDPRRQPVIAILSQSVASTGSYSLEVDRLQASLEKLDLQLASLANQICTTTIGDQPSQNPTTTQHHPQSAPKAPKLSPQDAQVAMKPAVPRLSARALENRQPSSSTISAAAKRTSRVCGPPPDDAAGCSPDNSPDRAAPPRAQRSSSRPRAGGCEIMPSKRSRHRRGSRVEPASSTPPPLRRNTRVNEQEPTHSEPVHSYQGMCDQMSFMGGDVGCAFDATLSPAHLLPVWGSPMPSLPAFSHPGAVPTIESFRFPTVAADHAGHLQHHAFATSHMPTACLPPFLPMAFGFPGM